MSVWWRSSNGMSYYDEGRLCHMWRILRSSYPERALVQRMADFRKKCQVCFREWTHCWTRSPRSWCSSHCPRASSRLSNHDGWSSSGDNTERRKRSGKNQPKLKTKHKHKRQFFFKISICQKNLNLFIYKLCTVMYKKCILNRQWQRHRTYNVQFKFTNQLLTGCI